MQPLMHVFLGQFYLQSRQLRFMSTSPVSINCKKEIGEFVINRKLIKNVIVIQPYTSNNNPDTSKIDKIKRMFDNFANIFIAFNRKTIY